MTVKLCCLWLTLLTANVADLSQTATCSRVHPSCIELNPLASPLVEGRNNTGEIFLGTLSVGAIIALESYDRGRPWTWMVEALWLTGHAFMIRHNERNQLRAPPVMFPVLTVSWP